MKFSSQTYNSMSELNFFVFLIDPCKKKLCEFYSKCIKGSDGKAECACPVCDNKEQYSPVCGDDGKTYASQCELENESCAKKRDIKTAKEEACGKYRCIFESK